MTSHHWITPGADLGIVKDSDRIGRTPIGPATGWNDGEAQPSRIVDVATNAPGTCDVMADSPQRSNEPEIKGQLVAVVISVLRRTLPGPPWRYAHAQIPRNRSAVPSREWPGSGHARRQRVSPRALPAATSAALLACRPR